MVVDAGVGGRRRSRGGLGAQHGAAPVDTARHLGCDGDEVHTEMQSAMNGAAAAPEMKLVALWRLRIPAALRGIHKPVRIGVLDATDDPWTRLAEIYQNWCPCN